MKVFKIGLWWLMDIFGFRRVVEKYLPVASAFFLTIDGLHDIIKECVKSMRDGTMTAEERLSLARSLELYRVVVDDTLINIIECLREDEYVEESTDLDS